MFSTLAWKMTEKVFQFSRWGEFFLSFLGHCDKGSQPKKETKPKKKESNVRNLILFHYVYCKYKMCSWVIINFGVTPHCSSVLSLYQLLWPAVYILYQPPLSPSISPTASRRNHVKLLSEQLKLHTIPPLLFLTSGDTVTVDLSSPIKEEVSHFSAPGCQHSFLS